MNKSIERFEPWNWLIKRNTGFLQISERQQIYQHLYSKMEPVSTWNPHDSAAGGHHGAIFNFDYSTDGSMLIATCQHRSFLMFDPFNGKLIGEKLEAHTDCVNCVRFLDTRLFATCSDDRTVVLWDCRFLKTKIKTLYGHTHWVKNIEYDCDKSLLVTSGFDGKICTWDVNNYSSYNEEHKPVFSVKGLMRSKLTPDSNKLIISTSRGYMIIIHDLNLLTLASDLHNFKPDVYRVTRTNAAGKSELVVKDNPFFHRKTNRVEFISDFPTGNEAEVVASLQVHPHGWCIVSRNTSADSDSEWVCVHDIQSSYNINQEDTQILTVNTDVINDINTDIFDEDSARPSSPIQVTYYSDTSESSQESTDADDADEDDDFHQSMTEALLSFRESSGFSHNFVLDSIEATDSSTSCPSPVRGDKSSEIGMSSLLRDKYKHPSLQVNKPRLLFYLQEPNVGEGFIKELCFSYDGRVICSPYKDGVRLLTFNEDCVEVCDCVPSEIKKLQVYRTSQSHKSYVLATKFSPTHYMFASGSLSGKVVFHQPVL